MRELWLDIARTSGAKVYSLLVGVFVLSLTARLLGPEGRGQIAVITTWVGLFATFTGLSLGQVALYRMALDPAGKRFGYLLGSLLFLVVLLTTVGWLTALNLYWYSPNGIFERLPGVALVIGFVALPFMIWEQYGSSLLMGLGHINIYNKYQVVSRTLSAIAVFVFVGVAELGVVGAMSATLFGQVIVALGGFGTLVRHAHKKGSALRPEINELRALLLGGAKLHLNAIGTFLFSSANVLILNRYHGPEQAGYFQLAAQLIGILMIIPQAANMVIYGKVASLGANGAWPDNKRLLVQTTLMIAALGLVAGIFAPWVITLLAGDAFKPSIELFRWMILGLIGMTFSTVMAPQWIGRGYFWQAATVTLLVGIISVVLNFVLIPSHGLMGAVYSYIGTYLCAVVGNGIMAWHCEKEAKP